MTWKYIEYQYAQAQLIQKVLAWFSNVDAHIYFAYRLDTSDWEYYAGNASHALATGQLLTKYTVEADAQTNYLSISAYRETSGKVLAILPAVYSAKYARIYIESGSAVELYEWINSTYFSAHEITTGELVITDQFLSPPLMRVVANSVDRIKIGKVGSYYGLYGYDGSENKIFELSDYAQTIAGWNFTASRLSSSHVYIDNTGEYISLGATPPTSYGNNIGAWLGYTDSKAKLSLYASATEYLQWDGATLSLSGAVTAKTGYIGGTTGWTIATGKITSTGIGVATVAGDVTYAFWAGNDTPADAEFRVTHAGKLYATGAEISGTITATLGHIGGFAIDETTISAPDITPTLKLDSAIPRISLQTHTFGGAGVQLEYTSSKGKLYAGDGSTNFVQFDGTNISWKGINTELTAAGAFTASNATITGTINATLGKFGTATNYWSVGATGLTAVSASADVIINYGKTDFGDTTKGFILGYDYSVSKPKFEIGDATSYLNWSGDALTFTKGTLVENIIQMYTSVASLATSATAGDGSANSAGIKVTYEGIFGCGANQTATIAAANANIRILATGDAYFKGDITATSGYFTSVTLGKTGVASGTLTLQFKDGGGDTYINYGKTTFTNTDAGFILGVDDDSVGNLSKFYIGSSTSYFNWDGSGIIVAGDIKTSPTVGTTQGVHLDSTNNELYFYGNRGDGTVEKLASIGINSVGSDYVIGKFGSETSTRTGLWSEAASAVSIRSYLRKSGVNLALNTTFYNNVPLSYAYGISNVINCATTDVSSWILGNSNIIRRGYYSTDTDKCGRVIGDYIELHHGVDYAPDTTSLVSGLTIIPYLQSGKITDFKAINIEDGTTGATITNNYAIYQESTVMINFFAGYTLAKGGIRIGTTATDPGDNNFYVEGTSTFAGAVTLSSTINKVTITPPATSATLTIATGKTFTCNNTITISGTDSEALVLTKGLTVTTNAGTLAFSAASKTLTVEDSATVSQDYSSDASPTFTTVKLSGLTDTYVPYHVSDSDGLANSPIAISGTDTYVTGKFYVGSDGTPQAAYVYGSTYMYKETTGKAVPLLLYNSADYADNNSVALRMYNNINFSGGNAYILGAEIQALMTDSTNGYTDLVFSVNHTNPISLLEVMRLTYDGNVNIMSATAETGSVATLNIPNGTAPDAHVDNQIIIYSADSSDNTATLALYLEQAVEDIGTFTASHKIKVFINGTAYWLQLDAV